MLRQFEPDLVIVSAGFDAHERDPLGGMRLTTPAFAAMTSELRAVAEECCRGRIVATVEGGYDLHALAESLDASHRDAAWPAVARRLAVERRRVDPGPRFGETADRRIGAVLDDRAASATISASGRESRARDGTSFFVTVRCEGID